MKRTTPGSTPANHDTTALNRARQDFSGVESVWLFGYGSLIYKVDFPYIERKPATIRGWSRRLWQGSHDHRGTFEHPGRVATLVPEQDALCTGIAYRVTPATFAHLDHREKNGYLRFTMTLDFADGQSAEGIVYIACAGNAAWLGPANEAEIARHVATAAGPSGSNRDYVLKLARALRELGADDRHVFAVEAELRGMQGAA
ncbi:MAG: gamma-glutamylcyclotransferase [Xanthomonadales bacterium]|nr:gamma-glutamylcyclotransferase [Xanthomonadales bacterium]ODU94099.1 MAG: gamma-glutamylcyclotransferase [Rhodanobacter sp. SCN 66-43]OJY83980.1 MAG: gamma-glutamylcyclotransferase [Xanthomonadales bacterium 66-474]